MKIACLRVIAVLLVMVFISCSKEDGNKQTEEQDNPADTNLTPEEKFSAAILIDFLNDSDDDDLALFLETEVYKMGGNFTGAAVVELTPSTWLVGFQKDSTVKNYLLQKYIDFKTNEPYFTFKETILSIPDVVSLRRPRESAGE